MHLLVLGGPTATGKTALAAEAAHALGVDLISADSRQVYRGLDLGTGKDREEYLRWTPPVTAHLLDIVEPEEVFSLFQYQAACYRVMDSLSRRPGPAGRLALFTGGSGLYMEAVLRRYRIANVPEDPALRTRLESMDPGKLKAELGRRDPALAAQTDISSKKRIIRALEIAAWAESRPVEYSRPPETDFSFTVFATALDRKLLRERIDRRLDQRLEAGLIEEVEGLMKRGLSAERFNLLGMEYREIAAFLRGEKSREGLVADLRHEIHLLAKRQETYFRGMPKRGVPVRWLRPDEGVESLLAAWRGR
jgi:tRNA dimethylallyltransferase